MAKRALNPLDYLRIGVRNSQDALTEAALRIEYPGEKTGMPRRGRLLRPCNEISDFLHAPSRLSANRIDQAPIGRGCGEHETGGLDLKLRQVFLGPVQRFV